MKDGEVDIVAIGLDVLITINGESSYLALDLERLCDWTESVMCKANCDDVLKIAHALDSIRDDIQNWYDKWKSKDFSVIK